MSRFLLLIAFAIGMTVTLGTFAETNDWPQWRGPDRTGISQEKELLQAWPEEGPTLLWLNENCGIGYSAPTVAKDHLVTMGARDNVEQLICLDANSGEELWAIDVGENYENGWGDGPRSSPTIDGERVFALGANGDLVCAELATGKVQWKVDLADLGGSVPDWGYSESVLVDGNQVVCTPGGDEGALIALDKQTGKKIWQSESFTDAAHYSSVIVADVAGQRQYIQLTQRSVVGIDAKTGKVLWRTDWPGRVAVVPTPIYRDGHVYVSSGYGAGCDLFRIGPNGEVASVYDEEVKKVMKNHHGGVVLVGDHLFGYSDRVGWVCQEWMSGELVWREREALGKGALCYADGRLYCLSKDDGMVVLVEPIVGGWQEHGRFKLSPQTKLRKPKGRIWTHPIVANGRLFLRDQELLFCYDVKQQE
ncbi:MAG: PQQ-binding-like beta-propeller repeat protein [Planctomycetaceae bacterium]|nr:PQQ-binding-like beta-propeller repeat protein [Planctomycetaceae bacterium]